MLHPAGGSACSRIRGFIASGRTGDVYRAYDVQLRRDGVLKILTVSLAADSDRVAHFECEARLLAASFISLS